MDDLYAGIVASGDSKALAELRSEMTLAGIREAQAARLVRYALRSVEGTPDDDLWPLLERATGPRREARRRDGTLKTSMLARFFRTGPLPITVRWDNGETELLRQHPDDAGGFCRYESLVLEVAPRQGDRRHVRVGLRSIDESGSAVWLFQHRTALAPEPEKARAEALAILREYSEWLRDPKRGSWWIEQVAEEATEHAYRVEYGPQKEMPPPGEGDLRSPKWFSDATDKGLYPDLLRVAVSDGRLTGSVKTHGRWTHSMSAVSALYPDYAAKIAMHKQKETEASNSDRKA